MSDIERVVAALRARWPDIPIEQLRVRHPDADDDGLWSIGGCQLESPTHESRFSSSAT